ncbi:helix-turn-helix domain-containing protein [Brevibacillus sp. B_LB10_24]|uniref:helix-turn-helix domain-containing protein n=1 Tax=Brevibacillus sp. B_LB10_24 TaxID=3380645 RepID=UPI0038BC9FDB
MFVPKRTDGSFYFPVSSRKTERNKIMKTLQESRYNVIVTAQRLGISRGTLPLISRVFLLLSRGFDVE